MNLDKMDVEGVTEGTIDWVAGGAVGGMEGVQGCRGALGVFRLDNMDS